MYLIGIYRGGRCAQACTYRPRGSFWRSCELDSKRFDEMSDGELVTSAASVAYDACTIGMPLDQNRFTAQMLGFPGCMFKVISAPDRLLVEQLALEIHSWRCMRPNLIHGTESFAEMLYEFSYDTYGKVEMTMVEFRSEFDLLNQRMSAKLEESIRRSESTLKELFMSPESVYQFS
jgi:hypothetical protein